jgi:hypothetical protein
MLGGFWARQADGHPGPDLLSRGLLMLNALVQWEQIKKTAREKNGTKEPRRKPGLTPPRQTQLRPTLKALSK